MMSSATIRSPFAWGLITVLSAAVVSALVSFQAGVFLLLFTAIGWWSWEHTEESFLLLLVLLPILPMFKITQTIGTVTLVKDVIILALFARLVAWPLVKRRLPYRRNVLLWPIVVLLAWVAVSTLRADSLILGVLRARDIVLYMLLYFGVLYLEHDAQRMRERWRWFIGASGVAMVLGVYQWFFAVDSAVQRFDPVREVWIPRLSGAMAHPSIYGEYLVVATLLVLSVILISGIKQRRQTMLLGGFVLVAVGLIFLTYSRAVWIGLVVGGGLMGLAWLWKIAQERIGRRRLITAASGLGGVGLLGVLLVTLLTPAGVYLRAVVDPTYGSNAERLEFAARLLAPLSNTEALIGRGLGDVLTQNFREVDLEAFDIASGGSRAVQLTKNKTLVDNQYLKTMVEMGLVGLLIYGWLYWIFLKESWMKMRGEEAFVSDEKTENVVRYQKMIGLWGVGFIGAFVVQGLFIDIWDIFPTNALFWIVAAFVSVRGAIDL